MDTLIDFLPYPKLTLFVVIFFAVHFIFGKGNDDNENDYTQSPIQTNDPALNKANRVLLDDSISEHDDASTNESDDDWLSDPVYHHLEFNDYHGLFNDSIDTGFSDDTFDSSFDNDSY
ncbi:hypothetical protein H5185_04810 [Shewanella sp. SG44-6]|jgi:hypothetical protein|uniref:hypothetical protein n=1 Tax=Shewanella sp. SG44-6 TaxID=2760959 RepID=UPI0015FFE255|nr:hypothetical protein [Shewanella sp. SG44-6]MBB1388744.1 hypothetical protein [Shewanella sp. SG44-6]